MDSSDSCFRPRRHFKELKLYKLSRDIYRKVFVNAGINALRQDESQQELEANQRLKEDPGFARVVFVGALLLTIESYSKNNSLDFLTLSKLCGEIESEKNPEERISELVSKDPKIIAQFERTRKTLAHILYLWEIASILERFKVLGLHVDGMIIDKLKKKDDAFN